MPMMHGNRHPTQAVKSHSHSLVMSVVQKVLERQRIFSGAIRYVQAGCHGAKCRVTAGYVSAAVGMDATKRQCLHTLQLASPSQP